MAFKRLLECINSNRLSEINGTLVNQAQNEIETKKKKLVEFCKDRSPSIDFDIFAHFLDIIKYSNCSLRRERTKQLIKQVENEYATLCDYVVKAENVIAAMRSRPKPVSKEEPRIQRIWDDDDEQGPEPLDEAQRPEVLSLPTKQSEQQSVKGTAEDDKPEKLQDHRAEQTRISKHKLPVPRQHIDKQMETSAADMTNENKSTSRVLTVASVESVSNVDAQHTSSLDVPNSNETQSLNTSLFTSNDIMAVAGEYCKLFNEDREYIHRVIVDKYRKGNAEVTEYIFNLMKGIYTYTSQKASEQIHELVEKTKAIVAGKNTSDNKISDEYIDILRQFRRIHGMESVSLLKQGYRKPDGIGSYRNQDIERFTDKCIELLWCVCIHDPPMSLDFNTQFENTDDLIKTYIPYKPGQQGKRIDRPLWPPLRLSTKGPILVKGLAHLR